MRTNPDDTNRPEHHAHQRTFFPCELQIAFGDEAAKSHPVTGHLRSGGADSASFIRL
jgi:hypothetical protein